MQQKAEEYRIRVGPRRARMEQIEETGGGGKVTMGGRGGQGKWENVRLKRKREPEVGREQVVLDVKHSS